MEDRYRPYETWNGTFVDPLLMYSEPMTNHQFIQRYNFNNPKVEEDWNQFTKSMINEKEEVYNSSRTFGDYKIKICYL